MTDLNPQDYNVIAQHVYRVDPIKHPKKQLSKGEPININGKTYQVIDAIGNDGEPTDNSLQAMAVAEVR